MGIILSLLLSLLNGACYSRANASCTGNCVANDTFYVVGTTLAAYKVDNAYYAAAQTFIPASCLNAYKSTLNTSISFDSAFKVASDSVGKSKAFWNTFELGIDAGMYLFSILFAINLVRKVILLSTRSHDD